MPQAERSAEVLGIAHDTGYAIFKCPKPVPVRAASSLVHTQLNIFLALACSSELKMITTMCLLRDGATRKNLSEAIKGALWSGSSDCSSVEYNT
eukprot:6187898-Pleurochrysis_carterae.AAC.1